MFIIIVATTGHNLISRAGKLIFYEFIIIFCCVFGFCIDAQRCIILIKAGALMSGIAVFILVVFTSHHDFVWGTLDVP
ncbi:hypothetical protein B1219_31040 [Pseudomonas ogarae]|nr:hypothetical protein B1219_31040 [Pseudomonas ogarae]OPG76536.1 hypothetical protein B1218_25590 [Pseudomonas ogarae]